jgi:hypothetical protein
VANLSLVFDLLARDRASKEFDKVADASDRAGDSGSRFGKMMKGGIGLAAGALAGAGIVSTLVDFYDAAAESEKIGKLTANVIKQTGAAAGVTAEQVGDLATALSNKTGQDDEAIQSAENLLLTFTNVRNEAGAGNDVFSQTTALALDMSTALGTDASGAAMQLGKALNDPIKGVGALSRSGVSFTKQQKEQIRTLVESGDVLAAQRIILAEVGKEFGGAAEAAATPLDRLKVTAGNLQEQIGAGLIPAFNDMAGVASQAISILFQGDFTGGPLAEDGPITAGLFAIRIGAENAARWVREDLGPALSGIGSTVGAALGNLWDSVDVSGLGPRLLTAATTAAGNLITGLRTGVQTGNWAPLGEALATGIGNALHGLAAGAGTLYLAVSDMIGQVDWFGLAMKLGEQVPTLLIGLATGILNFDIMSLLSGIGEHWFEVLMGLLALAFAPAKFIGKIGEILARIPLVGRFLQWLLLAAKGLADRVVKFAGDVIRGFGRGFTAGGSEIVGRFRSVFETVKTALYVWGSNIIGWFRGLPARFVQIAENLGLNLRIKFEQATSAVGNAVRGGFGAVLSIFRGIPGQILGALGNLGSTLYNSGRNMIQGLINGAGSLLRNIGSFFLNMLPGWIRGPFESAMGMRSPSKVFRQYGINIGAGLVQGLAGSSKDVQDASKKLAQGLAKAHEDYVTKRAKLDAKWFDTWKKMDAARKRTDKGAAAAIDRLEDSLHKQYAAMVTLNQQYKGVRDSGAVQAAIEELRRGDDRLIDLARHREQIAKQLEAARDRLADAIKTRKDFAASVRDSARSFASLTQIKTAGSPRVLVDELQQRLTAVQKFRAQLAKLAKLGVSRDVYQQIAEAGVEAGGATANALLAGGPKTIKQVNKLQSGIASESNKLGTDASRRLYQAGVDAATGLANGLSKQSKELKRAAERLAGNLEDAVKRRLGIRSPSSVFEGLGTSIGEGLANGIKGMQPAVAAELAALADTQAVQSLQAAVGVDPGARGGTAAGYRPPAYDTAGVGAATPPPPASRTVTVSGVVGPAEVAALVAREQRRDEFLSGAGS